MTLHSRKKTRHDYLTQVRLLSSNITLATFQGREISRSESIPFGQPIKVA